MKKKTVKIKKKKISRSNLVKKLDKVFADYIKLRDCYICFTCGKVLEPHTRDCQNGHLLSRAFYSVRWNELNAHCQCSSCNYKHEFDFSVYLDKYIKIYGLEQYNNLRVLKNQTIKYSDDELLRIHDKYCSMIKILEAGS